MTPASPKGAVEELRRLWEAVLRQRGSTYGQPTDEEAFIAYAANHALPIIEELLSERKALVEALSELVGCNERWNADVQQIIGKPPTWTESYLDHARDLLSRLKGSPHD